MHGLLSADSASIQVGSRFGWRC